jgi:SAM-dependent methyltransferase
MVPTDEDAFGHALLDWATGGTDVEVLERDDGFTQRGAGPGVYLSGFRGWPEAERRVLRRVRGRVLDVGCGAGRVALELQRRGVDVVGLDSSPLAARAARLRGVRRVWRHRVEDLGPRVAAFDSILMFGNGLGVFGGPARARRALSTLARATSRDARVFVESTSPSSAGAPGLTRDYYRRNLAAGRPAGQLRLRYHYGHLVGEWFDWFYVSPRDLRALVEGTGWRIDAVCEDGRGQPFVAVLARR